MTIPATRARYGPDAFAALAAVVDRLKGGSPLAPVTVVVPNNYTGLATRRALGRRGSVAVSFVTVYRLAELLGATRVARTGRRPVSTPVLAGAVRAVLGDAPGRFEAVADHPATEMALVRAHRALSEVDDAGLARLEQSSEPAADVVRVHRLVAQRLAPRFSDEHALVDEAIVALSERTARLEEIGPVVVHLPQRPSTTHCRLLSALAEATTVEAVIGVTGDPVVDSVTEQALTRLRVAPPSTPTGGPGQPARVISVSDADDEVRHAVREVVAAAVEGVPLGRCAVVYGTTEPYARLLADALDGADIEWFGSSVRGPDDSLLGRSLLSLLALPDHDLARASVTAWLAAAPARDRHNRPAPAAAWERISRRAGVVAGRAEWRERLDHLAEDLESEADELRHDDEAGSRVAANIRHATRARELADFVDQLATDLQAGSAAASWAELAAWCRRLVRRYIGGEGLRGDWPEDERRAAERVEAVVDRLGELDGIDPRPGVAAFRRALQAELEGGLGRHGRFGHGVLVGPIGSAVGIDLDLVVVLGMAEGVLPARRRDDPLLPDRERRVVGPDLPDRAALVARDHHAYAAVLAASGRTVVTFPRGDLRRGAENAPSRWLPTADNPPLGTVFDEQPSFVAGLRAVAFPAHAQEYDTAALLAATARGDDPARHPLIDRRPGLRRSMELIRGRGSAAFTRFDGNLSDGDPRGVAVPHPTDGRTVVSATRLEAWATCPHAYFLRYVLGVDPVDEPEREYRMSPLVRGTLVHRILERWLAEAIADGAVPTPDQPWPERHRQQLRSIAEDECDRAADRGITGRPVYWARDRRSILSDLDATISLDDEQRRLARSSPIATELAFGVAGATNPEVPITLVDGRTIRLRGSLDRLDRLDDGGLAVIDYKTGSDKPYRSLSKSDPTAGGGHLQLVLYAAAARTLLGEAAAPARGAYWFVSARGRFEVHGYDITPEVEHTVSDIVSTISDEIEAGRFPLHPERPGWKPWVSCWYCEPDGLGTRDQWRGWERKRHDPRLLDYAAMVEPDLFSHTGGGDDG